jgi:hypothetical protein
VIEAEVVSAPKYRLHHDRVEQTSRACLAHMLGKELSVAD